MTEEQQKLVSKLVGFDFEIKYKSGTDNGAVDALLRNLQSWLSKSRSSPQNLQYSSPSLISDYLKVAILVNRVGSAM